MTKHVGLESHGAFRSSVISPELIRKTRAGGLAEAEWENGGRVLSCQDRIFVGAEVGESRP